jgi:HemY protein
LWIVHFPKTWARYRREMGLIKGHQALVRALSALASGDHRLAEHQAQRAQKWMPDYATVPTILLATAAEHQGHRDSSAQALHRLLETDARDLGVRGLVQAVLRDGQWEKGLSIARDALTETPRVWPLYRLVYDLECQMGDYAAALSRQPILIKHRLMTRDDARADAVILHTALARAAYDQGQSKTALKHARAAFDVNPSFVPSACLLVDLYRGFGRTRRALWVLHRAYQLLPHPDLIDRHDQMAPQTKQADKRLKYHETFLALAPEYASGQLMMARALMSEGEWHRARVYLDAAERLDPRQGVYRALAHFAELQGDHRAMKDYLQMGLSAAPDPLWMCARTGKIFSSWQALVLPEHIFGTVIWGVPGEARGTAPSLAPRLGRGV